MEGGRVRGEGKKGVKEGEKGGWGKCTFFSTGRRCA